METLNIHVSVILTEFVIKTFPQKGFQVQMVFTSKFYQIVKEDLTLILNSFQK